MEWWRRADETWLAGLLQVVDACLAAAAAAARAGDGGGDMLQSVLGELVE